MGGASVLDLEQHLLLLTKSQAVLVSRLELDAPDLVMTAEEAGSAPGNADRPCQFAALQADGLPLDGIDHFESRAGATLSIGDHIDRFYSIQRRHSAINYTSLSSSS